jgi:hypothetical protein
VLSILTISGSAYELDVEGRRIRRLANYADRTATARQAPDGTWQSYELLALLQAAGDTCLLLDWDGEGRCTVTSALLDRGDAARIQAAVDIAAELGG